MSTLAGRIGLAFDNARLFELQGDVAQALQQTLLPPALPAIAHLELAARYRVAEGGMDIGGDFYDVFQVEGGAWMLVVGDVCGKGPAAAAVTGLFRNTLRAVAAREHATVGRPPGHERHDPRPDRRLTRSARPRWSGWSSEPGRADVPARLRRPSPTDRDPRTTAPVERVDVGGTLLGVLPDPSCPRCRSSCAAASRSCSTPTASPRPAARAASCSARPA